MKREGLPIYGYEAWLDGQGRIRCGSASKTCRGVFGAVADGVIEVPDSLHREADGVWRLSSHAQRRSDRKVGASGIRMKGSASKGQAPLRLHAFATTR